MEVDSTFTIDFDIYSVDVDNSDCAGVTPSQASLDIFVNVDSTDSSSFSTIFDTFCVDYVLNGQTIHRQAHILNNCPIHKVVIVLLF